MTDTPCRDQACPKRHCYTCNARHIDAGDQTCIWCLGLARRWLRAIPDLAAQIRADTTGYPTTSPGISERTSRNADTPLMGGDRTSLTGPGGDGRNAAGYPHNADNQAGDPPSAVAQLEQWERDWRETLHLHAAMTPATLSNVTQFLLDNLGWAAQHHPAFDDFHTELRQLHAMLEHAAGHRITHVTSEADCLCGNVRLIQKYGDHGLEDQWSCPRCKTTYDRGQFYQAYRATLNEKADRVRKPFSVNEIAALLDLTPDGVRKIITRYGIEPASRRGNVNLYEWESFRLGGYVAGDNALSSFSEGSA